MEVTSCAESVLGVSDCRRNTISPAHNTALTKNIAKVDVWHFTLFSQLENDAK